jgi:hypothetical protein
MVEEENARVKAENACVEVKNAFVSAVNACVKVKCARGNMHV